MKLDDLDPSDQIGLIRLARFNHTPVHQIAVQHGLNDRGVVICGHPLVRIAMLLVGKREISIQEIELWIEHVGAAPKDDLSAKKEALANWYGALQAAGLRPDGVNEMERFIRSYVAVDLSV